MSTKFNSAQNDEREGFASETERKEADLSAPAEDAGDSELNIQDLLKKYLPDYTEETHAEEKVQSAVSADEPVSAEKFSDAEILTLADASAPEQEKEAYFAEEFSLAAEEEELPAAFKEEPAVPPVSEQTFSWFDEEPKQDAASLEEESVPQKKRGGLFARFRKQEKPEEDSAAPDSAIFSELVKESGSTDSADIHGIPPFSQHHGCRRIPRCRMCQGFSPGHYQKSSV